jgi:hypothetical protein
MFAAKKISISEIETPPSPAAIAAGVRKSGAHQSLVLRIQKLEADRQAALDEMRALIAANRNELNDKAIRLLEKTREAIEETLRPLRMEIRGHREGHSTRVREALLPQIESAARTMVEALSGLTAAATLINAAETEIERAGGDPSFIRLPYDIGSLELYARQLMEKNS